MAKKLLIVESPAKAKTIEKYLGGDFSVKSSYGHIRDLEKGNDLGVDVANHYHPNYIVTPDKYKTVKELKDAAAKSDEVWLATDEDREGEAISWHLCEVLGLDTKSTKRIVFHEITKPAIQKAILTPRNLDMNIVNAQQARRVLDRLVGWELSGLLWKKVKGQLSAGRVQSVSVKLVVERERDIQAFKITPFFKVEAHFLAKNTQGKLVSFKAEAPQRFDNPAGAEDFLKKCVNANYKVDNIEVKPTRRKPAPPFTTSTLQQEASRKIGFSVSRTMSVAQKLYEEGFITYMRTDSTNLSESALIAMGEEIVKQYGPQYHHLRRYKTKNDSAQEAHEAIRPTYMERQSVSGQRDEQRLYELIWKRAMASQMADAELEKTIVDIAISTQPQAKLVAEGEVLKFDGFLKLYLEGTDDEDEETSGILPPLKVGQPLDMDVMTATERFTRPPARFTEASLVKKLEELGIGRPSTYAPTISKIMETNRGYVVKESREGEERIFQVFTLKNNNISKTTGKETTGTTKNVLYPLDMGMIVCDFLDEHFKKIMDYGFTASVEREFDDIAEGKIEWAQMIDRFYKPFHETVEKTLAEADRASGERILGIDPESGRTILVRMSSLGKPVIQIGTGEELDKKEKPRYANLRPGKSMETVSLQEALESFQLPRALGEFEGEMLEVNTGRYGPYVKFGGQFVSLPRGEDPFETTYERAVELIEIKKEADRPLGHFQNLPITKGKGRFGPFVKWAELYVNIPARFSFDTLTEKQAVEIIEQKIEKEANRYIQHWPEEQISIENGRWGPYIKYGKLIVNLPKLDAGAKMTADQARTLELAEVKAIIEKEFPGVFDAKKAPGKAGGKTAGKATGKASKPAAKKK
ncbi:MAG TPA: type I DNA topoisomerase [Saprospiraceae bacterium]|nr:type I DNA topoisomerase [Saprospiraceae bacterium]HPI06078.1 type I DNA topoisomerase [Saprospiraceae bacterium]